MKIAVYTICKNEQHNVAEFIKTVAGADVVVVCDTGSTDQTMSMFRYRQEYYADSRFRLEHIYVDPFRFDVARNAALALVPADVDVCVSLDMDERLSHGWRQSIERAWEKFPDLTRLTVNYETVGFRPFLHNSRVHKRNGFYWTDPCHEALTAFMADDNAAVSESLTITHKPDLAKPRTRLPLLEAGVAEQPWNSRRLFYYGRELVITGQYEAGLRILRHYLVMWAKSGQASWWETDQAEAYVKLAEGALLEQGQAISPSTDGQPKPPQSSEE